jgi:Phosphoesterase family
MNYSAHILHFVNLRIRNLQRAALGSRGRRNGVGIALETALLAKEHGCNSASSTPSPCDGAGRLITYDDSDGWYDHVLGPVITQSQTALYTLTGAGQCGRSAAQVPQNSQGQPEQGRCGLGARMPFLLVSPWARANYVSNTLLDQASVVKFIEDTGTCRPWATAPQTSRPGRLA